MHKKPNKIAPPELRCQKNLTWGALQRSQASLALSLCYQIIEHHVLTASSFFEAANNTDLKTLRPVTEEMFFFCILWKSHVWPIFATSQP